MGHFNDSPFAVKEANGFYASYEGGRIINRFTNQTCNLSIIFDFNCNSSASWTSASGQIGDPSEFLRNVTSVSVDGCQVSKIPKNYKLIINLNQKIIFK